MLTGLAAFTVAGSLGPTSTSAAAAAPARRRGPLVPTGDGHLVWLDGTATTGWFTNGRLPIPTFAEVLDLRRRLSRELGRELRQLPREQAPDVPAARPAARTTTARRLARDGLNRSDAPVFGHGPTYAQLVTPSGLRSIASYADGIGPDKAMVVPLTPDGRLGRPTTLVGNAHRAGLLVHPCPFRAENTFLPKDYQVGTDRADIGVAARTTLRSARAAS